MNQTEPMTLFGKSQIEKELNNLIKVERENIKKAISSARELGDLKENAEYHAAKDKQSQIEGRIMELQGKLSKANVIDVSKLDCEHILFGATVTVYDPQKDQSIKYQIVGIDEAKENNKISYSSPLAKALLGKSQGDTVNFNAPKGTIEYEVEKVEYI